MQTHRDPARALPSLCALLMQLHPVMEEGRYKQRAHIMLAREVAKWANAVRKAEQVRTAYPGQILDIVHGDFHRDPKAVIAHIYAFIGMDLTDQAITAMAQRIVEKPELKHGAHRYDIADFGPTEDEVRDRFGDYVQRFDLVEKRPAGAGAA